MDPSNDSSLTVIVQLNAVTNNSQVMAMQQQILQFKKMVNQIQGNLQFFAQQSQ